jgi:putative endonuclease
VHDRDLCTAREVGSNLSSYAGIIYICKMKRGGAVYIMANKTHTTLYVGVTSDLKKIIWEHKNFIFPDSFTAKYKTTKLVYYEGVHRIEEAIGREKQIKGGSRKQKEDLISSMNKDWDDLFNDVLEW